MPYLVQPIHTSEAPGIARAMISAFHQDRHWALLWGQMTLEEIIEGCTQRLPWNLVKVRSNKRHQKVVDEATGEIVGYARWILPKGFEHIWPEAQIEEPSDEEHKKFEAQWESATVNGNVKGSNRELVVEMSVALDAEEECIIHGEPYLCGCVSCLWLLMF